MALTYPQKQRIIAHLSRAETWGNRFDLAFWEDFRRKSRVTRLTSTLDQDHCPYKQVVTFRHASGARLTFDTSENDLPSLTDESGASILIYDDMLPGNAATISALTPQPDSRVVFRVPGTNLHVHFADDGAKTVIYGDRRIDLPAPQSTAPSPLQKSWQIHVASITQGDAESWDMDPGALLAAIKLVVACDLGIDPNIKAFNIASHLQPVYHQVEERDDNLVHFKGPSWQRKMVVTQKDWQDTVEFEGSDIPVPQNFRVEKDDDGFNILTSLDQREAIWSQGDIVSTVISSDATPVHTVTARTQPQHMLRLLFNGATLRDRRNREWSYVLVQTKESLPIALNMRAAVRQQFGLTARNCAIVTFDAGLCVIALATRHIDHAARNLQNYAETAARSALIPAP